MIDKDTELKLKIRSTVFRFTGNIEDRLKQDKEGNNVYIPTYTNGGFIILYDTLLDKIYNGNIEISASALRIIVYFAKHIGFNTNVIHVKQQDISKELHITLATVNKCIQYLKDIRVIYPAGHCDIIINHNYIFRGNMLQFYEDYKRLYPDQEGEIF
ncbi:MAG: replication/maintenance protein RepL [Bacilli bacterium]|nr:replication/maintenance protein RepL [Bacilli bacterium]